jgi:hypothetical protein
VAASFDARLAALGAAAAGALAEEREEAGGKSRTKEVVE